MTITLGALAEKLFAHDELILTAHVSPDADAVGSTFGLAHVLQSRGKKVSVFLTDPVPDTLRPLLPDVRYGSELPESAFEALVVLDTAAEKRVGPGIERLRALASASYNVDHHVSNIGWAATNYIDSQAPATAAIVVELLDTAGVPFDATAADLLYAGLLDDTGGFCFSNTNAKGFQAAARLVASGARPERVANVLYFSQPLRVLKLHAAALERLEIHLDGKCALIALSQDDLKAHGASAADTEGIIDLARKVQGVEVACFQRELEDGWKLSLRAKSDRIDVNAIAGVFGGGGHRAAAGCKIVGSADAVKEQVLSEIRKALDRVNLGHVNLDHAK